MQKQEECNKKLNKIKDEYNEEKDDLKDEYSKERNKLKDSLIALRVKDQNKIDTMIAELNDLTLMQRIRRKHFNKILNEMREHKENMLPLPDLEEEAHQL